MCSKLGLHYKKKIKNKPLDSLLVLVYWQHHWWMYYKHGTLFHILPQDKMFCGGQDLLLQNKQTKPPCILLAKLAYSWALISLHFYSLYPSINSLTVMWVSNLSVTVLVSVRNWFLDDANRNILYSNTCWCYQYSFPFETINTSFCLEATIWI